MSAVFLQAKVTQALLRDFTQKVICAAFKTQKNMRQHVFIHTESPPLKPKKHATACFYPHRILYLL